jgi:hypothetical protein
MIFTTIVFTPEDNILPTSKILEVPNDTLDPVQIQIFRNRNGGGLGFRNQQWFLAGDTIVSRSSGKVLRVHGAEDPPPALKPVFQDFYAPGGDEYTQKWRFSNNPDGGPISIFSQLPSDSPNPYAIDVPADQMNADGAKIQIWPYHGGPTQRWRLVQQDIPVFAIRSRDNYQVMDIPAFSHVDRELVHQNQYNGGPNQLWMINPPVGQGQYHRITAVHSDKLLQISPEGRLTQGAYDPNAQSQEWELIPAVNDSFVFQNRATGQALDASLDGDLILQNWPDVSAHQEWWTIQVDWLYRGI